jgi:uncharacterized protein YjlB
LVQYRNYYNFRAYDLVVNVIWKSLGHCSADSSQDFQVVESIGGERLQRCQRYVENFVAEAGALRLIPYGRGCRRL